MDSVSCESLGFAGAGQMATALARGLTASGLVPAERVCAFDPDRAAAERFSTETGCRTVPDFADLWEPGGVIVLAVKPQIMPKVLADAASLVRPDHLVVSIAAGVSLDTLQSGLGADCRLVRVMPNTPALAGCGAAACAGGGAATDDDVHLVRQLLGSVGLAIQVAEPLLDAVTGLSGSGPAYVYQFIEALSDGGVRMGLPRESATRLAAQTVLGAAKMVLETGRHPGELKDAVTSPGGTTIAGIHALEQGGLRAAVMNAVQAATERSRELGGN